MKNLVLTFIFALGVLVADAITLKGTIIGTKGYDVKVEVFYHDSTLNEVHIFESQENGKVVMFELNLIEGENCTLAFTRLDNKNKCKKHVYFDTDGFIKEEIVSIKLNSDDVFIHINEFGNLDVYELDMYNYEDIKNNFPKYDILRRRTPKYIDNSFLGFESN